jgi:hypothetical protein
MTTRFDVCSARSKKDGGTYWHKIGIMLPNEKGGYSIKLDSLPLPNKDGDVWISAFPPSDHSKRPAQQAGGAARSHRAELDDDIGF